MDFSSITSETINELQQSFQQFIPESMVYDSVERTCEFFHIDEPSIIIEGWATGVYTNNVYTSADDVLIYNTQQLESLGISGQDALDLVMTHEGTHRMLQGMETGFNPHLEELCCDFMAGVRAGLNNMDVTTLENALGDTVESDSHPDGTLRVDAIEMGVDFAYQYLQDYGFPPTFNECYKHFSDYNTTEHHQVNLREDMDLKESIMRHYQRMIEDGGMDSVSSELHDRQLSTAQSEYELAKAKYEHSLYDEERLKGESHNNVSFKGIFINDKAYCEKMAKHYFEQEEIERKDAANSIANGNKTAATKHQNAAKTNHDLGVRYQEMAKKSTK